MIISKSKPKELRSKLFKGAPPVIREIDINHDMAVLWAAHKKGAFNLPEVTQEEFRNEMNGLLGQFNFGWMIEDVNSKFSSGRGPVTMVVGVFNQWELEPKFFVFPWATLHNRLRCGVSFVQKSRYSKDIGIITIMADSKRYWSRVRKYFMAPEVPRDKGVLGYVGRIPDGNITEDRHIYYIRCRA